MRSTTEQISERNFPIISTEVQKKISETKILIAGCGLGSLIAESFARIGFCHFTLIDNDIIEVHNLNRQAYAWEDIGSAKVTALKKLLLAINPQAEIIEIPEFLNERNVDGVVPNVDLIIDTIDFLDLKAIVQLHDKAMTYDKPIISVFAASWGALGLFIPPEKRQQSFIRDIFEVTESDLNSISYTAKFTNYFTKLAPYLDLEVQKMMSEILLKMKDNKPCPASVIISGAQFASIIATKFAIDFINGISSVKAPDYLYLDLNRLMLDSILKIK